MTWYDWHCNTFVVVIWFASLFDFFCADIQFYVLLSPYLCLISFLYLNLYALGDDASISKGSFMQTNIPVSWSTSELRVRLASWNWFKLLSTIFYWTISGSIVLFMSCLCHDFASVYCCHLITCWERVDLLAFDFDVQFCLCHFPMWYPWSGEALDCIDSWSLQPFLL